jgi:hypothetical protein
MKAWTIVGYTYKAENLCLDCAHGAARRENPDPALVESMSVETELNDWANTVGIDRDDEESYDSNDFPKVIFVSMVEWWERCDECNAELI